MRQFHPELVKFLKCTRSLEFESESCGVLHTHLHTFVASRIEITDVVQRTVHRNVTKLFVLMFEDVLKKEEKAPDFDAKQF